MNKLSVVPRMYPYYASVSNRCYLSVSTPSSGHHACMSNSAWAASGDKGAVYPRCKSTNTDKQGGIWHCYDCGKEW